MRGHARVLGQLRQQGRDDFRDCGVDRHGPAKRFDCLVGRHHVENAVDRLVAADAGMPELGEVIAGRSRGRIGDGDITICDLTGTGAQDTAIANLAFSRATARGYGTAFRS